MIPTMNGIMSNGDGGGDHSGSGNNEVPAKHISPRALYSSVRNYRAQATFNLMMRMAPTALAAVRQEFFVRGDNVDLEEFIYIMSKHLINQNYRSSESTIISNTPEQLDFASSMYELFKEIDMNGDGRLEWEEFTRLTVEKARLLNKRYALTGIPNYYDSSKFLDSSAHYRHRHDISHLCHISKMMAFALTEDHKNAIWLINARSGKLITTIHTDAVPLALENIIEKDLLIATCADMTMITISLDDPMPSKKFLIQSVWPTSGAQMSLAWISSNQILYSGSTSGAIHAWDIRRKTAVATLKGHTDIVMCLMGLTKLDNLVSASLDSTIGVWDTYTNSMILRLEGHNKGVFSLSYNPDFRLLVSCGFDHDAFVWSPFVNSLVFRLKGHHASLVGCQCVDNSPEIITADASGIFKIWDIRNFVCVQTFAAMGNTSDHVGSELTCFFHAKNSNPGTRNEVAARIFAASKWLFSFDQMRVVNERTTDKHEVVWTGFLDETLQVISVSTRNLTIWDIVLGSLTVSHENICGEEIAACCLDDRKRKIFVGDITGHIRVYNPINGGMLKACPDDMKESVQCIAYVDESKRFIGGYANGYIRIYDDTRIDDCMLLRSFDLFNISTDLTHMSFSQTDRTVVSAGTLDNLVKLWDYDTGKSDIELEVCSPNENIVNLIFLHPYPLLVTADSLGNVIIWGTLGSQWQGHRIAGFLNQTPNTAEYEPISLKSTLNAMSNNAQQPEPPRRIIPCENTNQEEDSTPKQNANIPSSTTSSAMNIPIPTKLSSIFESAEVANYPSSSSVMGSVGGSGVYLETIVPHVLQDSLREASEQIHKWGPLAAARTIAWDSKNSHLYTGDEIGTVRKWDLSDLIADVGGAVTSGGLSSKKIQSSQRGIFKKTKHKHRNTRSAMVPISTPETGYLLGQQAKGSYLGIEFEWAVTAHHESIIHSNWTEYGLLTSCTARLLKMWTTDGRPIGMFMNGVPIGLRSHNWDLELDVESLMKKERDELNDIMERVMKVSRRTDLPKIASGVVSNMDSSATIAKLSTSSLRKRIQQSSRILGLVFDSDERDDELSDGNDRTRLQTSALDECSMSSSMSKTSRAAIEEANAADLEDDDSDNDMVFTESQRKRRERSMQSIIDKYEGQDSVLPKLRTKTSGTTVDVEAIEGLSSCMNIENASLGSKKIPTKKRNSRKDEIIMLKSLSPSSSKYSVSKRLPNSIGPGTPIRQMSSKSSAGDEKAEIIMKKCSKYETFEHLQLALTDSISRGNRHEKQDFKQKKTSPAVPTSPSPKSPVKKKNIQFEAVSTEPPMSLPPTITDSGDTKINEDPPVHEENDNT